jgi:DNA-binding transcriptional LysR family regulator
VSELRALDRLEAGTLRLGAFPTANAALVPRAIAAFSHAHPAVTVTLREGTTGRQLASLSLGDIDMAVLSAFPNQQLETAQLSLEHLLDDQLYVALPPDHRLAGRRTVRVSDLRSERWIAGDVRDDDRLLSPVHLLPELDGAVAFVVREWTAKLGMVAAGLGVTLVSSLAIDATRADIALVPLEAPNGPRRAVYLATARDQPPSPAREQFRTHLRAVASSLAATR